MAATAGNGSMDSVTTPASKYDYCRSTEWYIFLGCSFGVYVCMLILISVGRVVCRRSKHPEDSSETDQDEDELSGQPHRLGSQAGIVTRVHLYSMALMKGANNLGKFMLVIHSLCVIASFVIYILMTYQFTDIQTGPMESRTLLVCHSTKHFPVVHVDFAINLFYLGFFIIRLLSSNSLQAFWLTLDTMADHLTLIPSVIMYALNKHMIVFQFARINGLKYLVNSMIYCNILRTEKYIRLVSLLIRIISIWAISAGLYQLIENVGDFWRKDGLTNAVFHQYHDCFYYMLITMSTVGYGDISPHSVIGKFYIIIFIVVALGLFTSIIPEVSDILTEKKKYRRNRVHLKSGKKHVVVVGKFTCQMMKTFFDDFFHSERASNAREYVAMLGLDEPDLELKALIKTRELYVTYLQGSVMCVKDLQRACLKQASAVVVISDQQTRNEEDEDMKNIMRVIAVKDFCPDVQVLVQLQLYRSKTYLRNIPDWRPMHGDQAICINELKYGILAQSCLVPGLSTLLCNLLMLRSCKSNQFPQFSWQEAYLHGVEYEFYKVRFSANFNGMTFLKAAEVCADRLGIVLLAVEDGKSGQRRTIINPGCGLKIDTDVMEAFVIATDEREARRLSDYACVSSNSLKLDSSLDYRGCSENPDSCRHGEKLRLCSVDAGNQNEGASSSESERILLDSSGYFHWAPNHSMEQAMLQPNTQYNFHGHIVVCVMEKSSKVCLNLTTFVMPLRASSIRPSKLKDIVFVGAIDVIRNEWPIIQNFPRIHVLDGSPLNRANLKAVNIESCHSCIILSPKSTPYEPDAQMDRETILCTLNIKTMKKPGTQKKLGDCIHIITELKTEDAIAYLDQDDDDEVEEPYMTQAFATGRTFFLSLLGSIVTTIYFNQASLGFLRTIVTTVDSEDFEIGLNEQGFHFMASDSSFTAESRSGIEVRPSRAVMHRRSCIELLSVSESPLKDIFTATDSITWKAFSLAILGELEIVCIGLSRLQVQPEDDSTKNHRFVMTLPQDSVIVRETDLVYCLTPPNLVL
ncbi:hypothetical protein BOX15_Mlig020881g2 [Macrostomum lignano]|uniref:BK channel n=1 Tax=Macrostomum lignano TaxID=282301 RepID=A0A267GT08_9PLAT|nr:hypothetical protein BOX15_Mlig020881g2 [Macrostomum lignano]